MRSVTHRARVISVVLSGGLFFAACSSGAAKSSSSSEDLTPKDHQACQAFESKSTTMNDALAAVSSAKTHATADELRAVNIAIVKLGAEAQRQAKEASSSLKAPLRAVATKVSPLELALSGQGGSVSEASDAFLKAAQAVTRLCSAQG